MESKEPSIKGFVKLHKSSWEPPSGDTRRGVPMRSLLLAISKIVSVLGDEKGGAWICYGGGAQDALVHVDEDYEQIETMLKTGGA